MKLAKGVALEFVQTVVFISVALFFTSCSQEIEVQVTSVVLSPLQSAIETNGKIEAEQIFEVRAPLSGFSSRILVREGEFLRRDQELLKMGDRRLRSELERARAELETARIRLRDVNRGPLPEEINEIESEIDRLRLEIKRAGKILETNEWLLNRKAISRYEVEQSRDALAQLQHRLTAAETRRSDIGKRYDELDRKQATSEVEGAQSRIEYLKESISLSVVRSPVDGILYQFEIKDGAFLNEGDIVGRVADLTKLRLRAFVDEPDVGNLEVGREIEIRWDAYPGESWTGKVHHIPPQVVSRGTRSVAEVLCSIDPTKQMLIPNINVDVKIANVEGQQVPALPRGVVFPEGERKFVWVARDGRAVKQHIGTGRSTVSMIEITEGLSPGDPVIDPGTNLLAEGSKVRVPDQ